MQNSLLFYNAFCKRQPDSGAVFSRILPSVKPFEQMRKILFRKAFSTVLNQHFRIKRIFFTDYTNLTVFGRMFQTILQNIQQSLRCPLHVRREPDFRFPLPFCYNFQFDMLLPQHCSEWFCCKFRQFLCFYILSVKFKRMRIQLCQGQKPVNQALQTLYLALQTVQILLVFCLQGRA